jgi:hypothetical protein
MPDIPVLAGNQQADRLLDRFTQAHILMRDLGDFADDVEIDR